MHLSRQRSRQNAMETHLLPLTVFSCVSLRTYGRNVCVCVSNIHVCTYGYTYYVGIGTYMSMYICMCIHVHTCSVCVYVRMHVCVYIRYHMCSYVCTYVHPLWGERYILYYVVCCGWYSHLMRWEDEVDERYIQNGRRKTICNHALQGIIKLYNVIFTYANGIYTSHTAGILIA